MDPIIILPLAVLGFIALSKKKGPSSSAVALEDQARNLYATAMSTGIKTDAGALELYAQKIDSLGVRPDLSAALRNQILSGTPEGNALSLYTTAMGTGLKNDVVALELYAQRIDQLGVRPDLALALRNQKTTLLSSVPSSSGEKVISVI